jgi:hypothetical protein
MRRKGENILARHEAANRRADTDHGARALASKSRIAPTENAESGQHIAEIQTGGANFDFYFMWLWGAARDGLKGQIVKAARHIDCEPARLC